MDAFSAEMNRFFPYESWLGTALTSLKSSANVRSRTLELCAKGFVKMALGFFSKISEKRARCKGEPEYHYGVNFPTALLINTFFQIYSHGGEKFNSGGHFSSSVLILIFSRVSRR